MYHKAMKADQIEEMMLLAQNSASAANNDMENAIRIQYRQLLNRIIKGQEVGWSQDEVKAIEKVVQGGPVENLLRYLGKFAPTGVVSMYGGGGAGFPFGVGGEGGTPQACTRQANQDVGSDGNAGDEEEGGTGGAGGDNDDQAGGQKGGDGGDNEQNPAAGPDDDSLGGPAGANGAAIRVTSGVSFTFGTGALDDGEIRPSSFATPGNAATGVA